MPHLPAVIPESPWTENQVDAFATELATDLTTGLLDLQRFRSDLSGLVYLSDVPAQVANRYCAASGDSHWSFRGDLHSSLMALMSRRALGSSADDVAHFLAGVSMSAWMRRFLTAAVASEARNLRTAAASTRPLDHRDDSDESPSDAYLRSGAIVGTGQASQDCTDRDTLAWLRARDTYLDASPTLRGASRLNVRAQVLSAAYGLPEPDAADCTPSVREQAHRVLDADEKVAYRVVGALADGESVTGDGSLLADFFSDWHIEDLENLSDADPRVAQALAMSAAVGRPPISRRAGRRIIARVCNHAPDQRSSALARRAVRSWIDSSTALLSLGSDDLVFKDDDVVQHEAARYAVAVTALLRSSFPIGSRQEFEDWVDALAREEITGTVTSVPEAVAV